MPQPIRSYAEPSQIEAEAAAVATPAQLPMLARLTAMGWNVAALRGIAGIAGRLRYGTATIEFSGNGSAYGKLFTDGSFKRN